MKKKSLKNLSILYKVIIPVIFFIVIAFLAFTYYFQQGLINKNLERNLEKTFVSVEKLYELEINEIKEKTLIAAASIANNPEIIRAYEVYYISNDMDYDKNHSKRLLTELSNLKPGEEGTVAFISGGHKASQRLLDMGLTKGTKLSVINSAPFRGPIEISVRGTSLALGRRLAGKVFIELKNDVVKRPHPHGPHH